MDEEIAHGYDAAKRREYYLRNRKLKGRKHGSAKPVPQHKSRAQRQAERRRQQQAKVAALKGRLERLREVLAAETKKAQARSGVKTAKPAAKKTTSHKNAPTKKLTAVQKAAKAKADEKRRKESPDQTLDEQVKSLTEKIKTIQERIAKMRKDDSVGVRKSQSK